MRASISILPDSLCWACPMRSEVGGRLQKDGWNVFHPDNVDAGPFEFTAG
jgi:hypothetical protein